MRDFRDAKAMAQTLREALKAKSVSLTHSESLELVARTLGFPDWNFLAARIQASHATLPPSSATAPVAHPSSIPAAEGVPVLPMRDLVLFPHMVTSIFVGRDKTRRAVDSAMAKDGRVLVVAQKRGYEDDPGFDGLRAVGVIAAVINRLTQVDGTLRLFVSGLARASIVRPLEADFLAAEVAPIIESSAQTVEAAALSRAVLDAYQVYAKIDYAALPQGVQARFRLPNIGEPGVLADSIAPLLSVSIDQKQQLLETGDATARLQTILDLMKTGQQAA